MLTYWPISYSYFNIFPYLYINLFVCKCLYLLVFIPILSFTSSAWKYFKATNFFKFQLLFISLFYAFIRFLIFFLNYLFFFLLVCFWLFWLFIRPFYNLSIYQYVIFLFVSNIFIYLFVYFFILLFFFTHSFVHLSIYLFF